VTSSALDRSEVEAFDAALIAPFERETPAFSIEGDCLYISGAEGIRGSKGALTAVGIEVASALCLYGIWQLWRLLR
jgi:hypothetical protein